MTKTFVIILLLSIISCNSSNKRNGGPDFSGSHKKPGREVVNLSDEAAADIVQNVASPVEIATILRSVRIPYSADCLAPAGEAARLTSDFQRALMLGIYVADLGYLNVYGETGNYPEVLSAIKLLADGLKTGEHFDFATMKRLADTGSGNDSLQFLSVNSFNHIDKYLRENGRGTVSSLMIAGLWIEGQHLATQAVADHNEEMLRDRIGEQKIILGDLLTFLQPFRESSDQYRSVYSMLESIYSAYGGVKVSYRLGEPETIEEDGRLVMVQHEESIVEMSDEQLSEIAELSREVRNKLISGI
jgi:hypothetical protein